MSGMDEVFGERDRPKSPDFWKMSAIVLKLDGRIEATPLSARQQVFEASVAEHVDLESVSYMAFQRAIRMLPPTMENMAALQMIASAFIDGFMVGSEFEAHP